MSLRSERDQVDMALYDEEQAIRAALGDAWEHYDTMTEQQVADAVECVPCGAAIGVRCVQWADLSASCCEDRRRRAARAQVAA